MFFFKKRKPAMPARTPVPKAPSKGAAPSAAQKRGTYRAHVNVLAWYTLENRPGVRYGRVSDLSAGGCRLAVDEDFMPGSLLHLRFDLPDEVLDVLKTEVDEIEATPFGPRPVKKVQGARPFDTVHVHAKNVVAFLNINLRRFEYGLSFHQTEPSTQEEIQRWIHGWQLLQLRNRRRVKE